MKPLTALLQLDLTADRCLFTQHGIRYTIPKPAYRGDPCQIIQWSSGEVQVTKNGVTTRYRAGQVNRYLVDVGETDEHRIHFFKLHLVLRPIREVTCFVWNAPLTKPLRGRKLTATVRS